jgi:serine/threonine protein kinase/dienelactone hydrolase
MIGKQIAHYQITEKIGQGGMGMVYKARDTHLDRSVAIKVLPPEAVADADRKRRFVQEARAASALNHPNIITIYDISQSEGVDFIAMEYLSGRTLAQLIPEKGFQTGDVLKYSIQIADALSRAHSAGIVHRDLKPSNIMVSEDDHVKILDFGLAKLAYREPTTDTETKTLESGETLTKEGTVLGTVAYMSPEQVEAKQVDARSDIFSFGAVLYEMLTGKRAFQGDSTISVMSSILRDHPVPAKQIRADVPREVERILKSCLEKDREARYPSGTELLGDLRALESHLYATTGSFRRLIQRPRVAIPLSITLLAIFYAGFLVYRHNANVRWARERALPEIERLVMEGNNFAAFDLAKKAEPYISDDPALKRLWPMMSTRISFKTNPPGAEIFVKDYRSPDGLWRYFGRSPLEKLAAPSGLVRWKIEKKDYVTLEACTHPWIHWPMENISLIKEGQNLPGMVRVDATKSEGVDWANLVPGIENVVSHRLDYYWMDKYEVTNRQFKEFMDQGGYQRREFWTNPFVENGRALSWDEAMARFRDTTGRPGPATWELGNYPRGQEDYPVSGVSWYEAAAYAEFAGKSLPTIFHWFWASGVQVSEFIIPLSNFGRAGPAKVGSFHSMSPWNTYDMAGNVKEWCWNAAGSDKHYILGGAWGEPVYMFTDPDARSPFDRSPELGFRCVKYLSPPADSAMASVFSGVRNYNKETPVSEQVFEIYRSFYSYDRTPLNARVESAADREEGWRLEKVSFDAAYGKDRVVAFLFLPGNARPPYQAVVFFPGSGAITDSSSEHIFDFSWGFDFITKSGRALIWPIYKGTYERKDDLVSDYPNMTKSYRDHVICWSKDLGRSIDYLETRPEIDRERIAYYGLSWGASLGTILPAVESRFKTAVLIAGGFYPQRALPEVDEINFAPRVKIPTLMINGRYDSFYPVEISQIPMFRLLGTPRDQKVHKICESGHAPLLREWYKETLDWLDRYLGPVRTL